MIKDFNFLEEPRNDAKDVLRVLPRNRRSIKKLGTVSAQPSNELTENVVFSQKKGSIKILRPFENHEYASSISLLEA